MRRDFSLDVALAAVGLGFALLMSFVDWYVAESATARAPAYRLCTHLDFFQLTPSIKLGVGSGAERRKLPSCVDVDEAFWSEIKRSGLFPVNGSKANRERDMLGLIVFLSTNIRGMPQGASLQVDTAPGGDYVLNIIRRASLGGEGR